MSFSSPPPHELIGPVLHQDEIAGFVFGLTEPQHYELLVTRGNIVTMAIPPSPSSRSMA
ncbi:MAG: hypothetical protein VYB51_01105 [Gemmatimonadota bacterium]|nr:hypothetical protein [Gemmatimonadota bacterium]